MARIALGGLCALSSLHGTAALAQQRAPELLCELRLAGQSQQLRQAVSADPYAAQAVRIGERFAFKAVVLGTPGEVQDITLSVYDLSLDNPPVMLLQQRMHPPFNLSPTLPALTGWNQVYSSVMGRWLEYGCALQAAEAKP